MVSIYLNDAVQQIAPTQSLQELLIQNNYIDQHFAVAVNNQLIPRMAYNTTLLGVLARNRRNFRTVFSQTMCPVDLLLTHTSGLTVCSNTMYR